MTADGAARKSVVVPLDGSVHALVALPVARALADTLQAVLHVVHVGERAFPPEDLLIRLGLSPADAADSVVDQVTGDPAAGILGVVARCHGDLIVMCAVTGQPSPLGIMGPIAEEILYEAACPVVLVRPERGTAPYTLGRILLPHDGTPTSAEAIGPGADLARRSGAELVVLHVASVSAPQPEEPGTLTVPRYVDQPQHEWPAWAGEFMERLVCLGCLPKDLALRLELGLGRPGEEILRRAGAERADLILLAWHGRLDHERAPILRAVIGSAPCPVMVLRAAPAPGVKNRSDAIMKL